MKKSIKRALSLVLAVLILSSMACIVASANSGEQTNPLLTDVVTSTEGTNTYYFYMPTSWRTAYNDHSTNTEEAAAGIYWWEGTGDCDEHVNAKTGNGWPGYRVTETVAPNIFVAHVPTDVPTIIWNNTVDGGEDNTLPEYLAAVQTANIPAEKFEANDIKDVYGVYPNGLASFNEMIFVCDPDNISVNEYSGKETYNGSWFYYYGNGEYGVAPTKAEAGDKVYSNGEFPQLGFSIDKEETYIPIDDTDTIEMKNYDPSTVFTIVDPTAETTPAETTPAEGTEPATPAEEPAKEGFKCDISISDPTVASISVKDGVVTVKPIKDGEATVSFIYTIPGETNPETGDIISSATVINKSCKVYVFTPDTEVKITAKAKTIYVKKTTTVSAKVEYGKGTTTFKSSNTKVATVNSSGKVTAKKAGKVTITATNNGVSAKVEIKVNNPTVKAKKSSIKVKGKTQITVKNAVGKTKFKALNKNATVNAKGKVVGKKAGTARIQVTASGVKFTVKIKVKK